MYLLAVLNFLLSLPPSAGSELCSLVSLGGVDDVGGVVVVVRDAVLLVGPLLGLDPLLEGDDDDLAGEDLDDASAWFCTPRFRLLDGDSVGRDGSLPTIVLRNPNPNPNPPSLTPSLCSISAILDLTILFVLKVLKVNDVESVLFNLTFCVIVFSPP